MPVVEVVVILLFLVSVAVVAEEVGKVRKSANEVSELFGVAKEVNLKSSAVVGEIELLLVEGDDSE